MRYALIALSILLGSTAPAMAQVSIGISIPGVTIGINQPVFPELVPVPGYPVYYAPRARVNYFFYDGLYWVYQDDRWYASSWYNGPWDYVEPDDVPLFVLRVPVRYYVHPPVYFRGWVVTAPPRWDVYWGPRWAQHRHGWDRWDRRVVYAPAPLPVYQRQYAGDRYPRPEQQHAVRDQHYRYQPRDAVVRRHYQERPAPRPQMQAQPAPNRADFPREQRPQREREETRRSEPVQVLPQQRGPATQEQRQRPEAQRAQPAPREREESRRPEGMQVLPQQRQQPQQREERAPRPQQAQDRGPDRGERPFRDNAERRQGPERGGDRGNDRGNDRGR